MGTPKPNAQDPTTLACPRCGYDLTPMVPPPGPARDAAAVCSECGLHFTWNGLFEALRQLLPRFVEHSKGRLATLIAIPWTFAWLILPHRFWRRITVERKVRLPRAFLWLVVIIPLTRLSETLVIFLIRAWNEWIRYLADISKLPTFSEFARDVQTVFDARREVTGWYADGPPPLELTATLLAMLAALMFLILPQTRRQAKVRLVLVARCWVYANALLAILFLWNLLSLGVSLVIPGEYAIYSGTSWDRIQEILEESADSRTNGFLWIFAAMIAWQVWYWFTALRSMRVRHAGPVAASMLTAAVLATTLFLLLSGLFPLESIM